MIIHKMRTKTGNLCLLGLAIVVTVILFPLDQSRTALSDRNKTRSALVSLLSLDGPEGAWYSSKYIKAAKKLAVSFRAYAHQDMVLMLVDTWDLMPHSSLKGLQNVGWTVQKVAGLSPAHQGWFVNRYYNVKTFSKLYLWRLTNYDLVLYVDLDMLFVGNPASAFGGLLESSNTSCALGMVQDLCNDDYFNSGVILLKPALPEYNRLLLAISTLAGDSPLADQSFLNVFFSGKICPLPKVFNVQISQDPCEGAIDNARYRKNGFALASGQPIVLIHYIAENKPWNSEQCISQSIHLLCNFWWGLPTV